MTYSELKEELEEFKKSVRDNIAEEESRTYKTSNYAIYKKLLKRAEKIELPNDGDLDFLPADVQKSSLELDTFIVHDLINFRVY